MERRLIFCGIRIETSITRFDAEKPFKDELANDAELILKKVAVQRRRCERAYKRAAAANALYCERGAGTRQ